MAPKTLHIISTFPNHIVHPLIHSLSFQCIFPYAIFAHVHTHILDGLTFLSLFACTIEKPATSIFPLIPYSFHIFFIFLPIYMFYTYVCIHAYMSEYGPNFPAHPPRSSFYEPHHVCMCTHTHTTYEMFEWDEMEAKLCTCKANCMSFFPPSSSSSSGIIYTHHIQNITTV